LLSVGDEAPDFELFGIDGKKHQLSSFRGRRVLLSFFRYAACPICLYSVDRMKQQNDLLTRADIVTICVYRSTPKNIEKFASKHMSDDFVALSDKKGGVYISFQVKRSFPAVLRSTGLGLKNLKQLLPYMRVDNTDFVGNGQHNQLPADFMIDEDGIIVDLFRARIIQDHMPFDRVEAFIPENKRCKCNKKDCISPRCRKEYEEIKKEDMALLHVG